MTRTPTFTEVAVAALYVIALARCHGDADTQIYAAKLREEGKSDNEVLRCLKRRVPLWDEMPCTSQRATKEFGR